MKNLSNAATLLLLLTLCITLPGCSTATSTAPQVAPEPETLSETKFTARAKNYFEYEPLHAGKAGPFRIHLTDLSDGSPVDQAQVTLTVSTKGSASSVAQTTSRIGKVTGIYVA